MYSGKGPFSPQIGRVTILPDSSIMLARIKTNRTKKEGRKEMNKQKERKKER